LLPGKRIDELLDECNQLCRILGKSVATAKGKRRPRAAIRWPRSQLALPDFQFSIFHPGFAAAMSRNCDAPCAAHQSARRLVHHGEITVQAARSRKSSLQLQKFRDAATDSR
jgi:hypothetical protein